MQMWRHSSAIRSHLPAPLSRRSMAQQPAATIGGVTLTISPRAQPIGRAADSFQKARNGPIEHKAQDGRVEPPSGPPPKPTPLPGRHEIEIKDADVLRLQPGDILLIKAPGVLRTEACERIKQAWTRAFEQAGVKGAVVMVQDAGLTALILRNNPSVDHLESVFVDGVKVYDPRKDAAPPP